MVNYSSSLDSTFAALADPVRRAMLARLRQGEASVGELAEPHDITLPGMLKHVRYLERAGLIEARKEGRSRICKLAPHPLAHATEWLADYRRFWEGQLDSLDRYLKRSRSHEAPLWQPPSKAPDSTSPARTTPPPKNSSPPGRTRKR